MTRATIVGGAFAAVLVLLALVAGYWAFGHDFDPALEVTRFLHETLDHDLDRASATVSDLTGVHEGLLYGRVTTTDGAVHEGRLRWGGDEEALWGNYFNARKEENPWAAYVPREQLPKERLSIGAFGFEIAGWDSTLDLGRPLMVRFGDIALIEPRGGEIRVTLKSGAMFDLDRYSADDLADGVRVWDERGGSVYIGEWKIRTIELFSTARPGAAPNPLHGTVRTRQGDFTGLIQWEREECLGSDELHGRTADGELRVRFDTIRSIARHSPDSSLVTLLDGREIVLSGTREAGQGNRGTYVDDLRYGRVLISWDALERVDFSPGGTGPAYDDFPPGRPITGSVVTRSGRRLSGALVYDLDESEATETLDAPWQGVDYTIPFGLVASIVLPDVEERGARRARVTLHSGEELQLELTGDLRDSNAGMLLFSDGGPRTEYVPWADVERIELDRPPEMYPPPGRVLPARSECHSAHRTLREEPSPMVAKGLMPILNVSDIQESFAWFEKLGWEKGWEWGDPPGFGGVCSGECEIFLCENGQDGRGKSSLSAMFGPDGNDAADQGVWMSIWVDDVDAVHRHCLEQGIEVTWPPTDMPWNVREMHVRHLRTATSSGSAAGSRKNEYARASKRTVRSARASSLQRTRLLTDGALAQRLARAARRPAKVWGAGPPAPSRSGTSFMAGAEVSIEPPSAAARDRSDAGRGKWVSRSELPRLSPMKRTIIFDGREYAGVDDMPPHVRRAYEEQQRRLREPEKRESGPLFVIEGSKVVIGDREIADLTDASPEERRFYERFSERQDPAQRQSEPLPRDVFSLKRSRGAGTEAEPRSVRPLLLFFGIPALVLLVAEITDTLIGNAGLLALLVVVAGCSFYVGFFPGSRSSCTASTRREGSWSCCSGSGLWDTSACVRSRP